MATLPCTGQELSLKERTKLLLVLTAFALCWYLPVESEGFWGALHQSLSLVKWYAREHVLLCLIPAFFIAGAVGVFVSQGAVMKYLGPRARKIIAYPVAATSGTILAICSCTVLPLFASIHKRGAGLGPATAFLYSGPAINLLAIILTARILGPGLGVARAVGAIVFSVVIGLLMHFLFRKEEALRQVDGPVILPDDEKDRPLWQDALYFAVMVGILVFANWGSPMPGDHGLWEVIYASKWWLSGILLMALVAILVKWFQRDELRGPVESGGGLIPARWIAQMVGGNSLSANLFASVIGAFMYFATLTEVPILEGLLRSGMGQGPALALLLSGPALSLPSILVIRSVMGLKKTAVFVLLVVLLSTLAGFMYGAVA
jgi:uncharacterized membrane protein YraQ (UPF0718 family)